MSSTFRFVPLTSCCKDGGDDLPLGLSMSELRLEVEHMLGKPPLAWKPGILPCPALPPNTLYCVLPPRTASPVFSSQSSILGSCYCRMTNGGVPWLLSRLKIQCCHCCSTGSIPRPGTSACFGVQPKIKSK